MLFLIAKYAQILMGKLASSQKERGGYFMSFPTCTIKLLMLVHFIGLSWLCLLHASELISDDSSRHKMVHN